MPDIRYPDGAGMPDAPDAPTPPSRADARLEEPAEESAWQSAVVRVSTMIAVWLGY